MELGSILPALIPRSLNTPASRFLPPGPPVSLVYRELPCRTRGIRCDCFFRPPPKTNPPPPPPPPPLPAPPDGKDHQRSGLVFELPTNSPAFFKDKPCAWLPVFSGEDCIYLLFHPPLFVFFSTITCITSPPLPRIAWWLCGTGLSPACVRRSDQPNKLPSLVPSYSFSFFFVLDKRRSEEQFFLGVHVDLLLAEFSSPPYFVLFLFPYEFPISPPPPQHVS